MKSRRVGIAAFVSLAIPLAALFRLLTDTDFLLDLYIAVAHHKDPNHAVIKLLASFMAIVGAALIAWLSPQPSAPPTETSPSP